MITNDMGTIKVKPTKDARGASELMRIVRLQTDEAIKWVVRKLVRDGIKQAQPYGIECNCGYDYMRAGIYLGTGSTLPDEINYWWYFWAQKGTGIELTGPKRKDGNWDEKVFAINELRDLANRVYAEEVGQKTLFAN